MADFVELSDTDFESTVAAAPVALIDFYASWCGACRMAVPMFRRVAADLQMPIYKVEAEQNQKARASVKIENLPTLALVKDGKIVGSICTTREESLREFLKEHGV